MHGKAVRTQCFVDDPLIALAGSEEDRLKHLVFIVLLWLALGYKINWKKGSRGRHLQWMGATISEWLSPSGVHGVSLSISRERIEKLSRTCASILSLQKVPREELQSLAGLATWLSGIMPQFSAYTAMLWAALNVGKAAALDIEAVQKPVLWLYTVCENNLRTVTRYCRRAA